jgi:hypothetical protein
MFVHETGPRVISLPFRPSATGRARVASKILDGPRGPCAGDRTIQVTLHRDTAAWLRAGWTRLGQRSAQDRSGVGKCS